MVDFNCNDVAGPRTVSLAGAPRCGVSRPQAKARGDWRRRLRTHGEAAKAPVATPRPRVASWEDVAALLGGAPSAAGRLALWRARRTMAATFAFGMGPAAREHLGLHGRPRRPRLRRAHACLGGGRLRGYGGTTLSTRPPRADHLPAVVAGAGARARAHSLRPGDARVEPRPRTTGC